MITNADGKIWLALRGKAASWTETTIHFPDDNYSPQADDSFVIVQHVTTEYGGDIPISMQCGQPLTGILNMSVMVPLDYGFSAHMGLAGRVADHFATDVIGSYSNVTVKSNGRPRMIGNSDIQSAWNRVEVQIPWIAWG